MRENKTIDAIFVFACFFGALAGCSANAVSDDDAARSEDQRLSLDANEQIGDTSSPSTDAVRTVSHSMHSARSCASCPDLIALGRKDCAEQHAVVCGDYMSCLDYACDDYQTFYAIDYECCK